VRTSKPEVARLPRDALKAFHADRALRNFRRMRILLGFMAPMHLAHVLTFAILRPGTDAIWRHEIITTHAAMAALGALLLVPMWHPRTRDTWFVTRVVPLGLGLLYLVVGAVVSAIDQRVTTAVHPFLEASIGVGIALRLSRRELVVAFLIDFAVFAVGISLAQPDPAVRMSLLVNGLTATALSAGLCLGFGAAHARDFMQRRVIDRQALELVKRNLQLNESLDALRAVNAGLATEIEERRQVQEELTLHATIDALTGLMNRRHFIAMAEREIARASRDRTQLVLATFDADHFKAINDSYGHDVGDEALRSIADCARGVVRRGDLVGRLGGEEFAVLMVGADLDQASPVVERLRASMAACAIGARGTTVRVSVSIGYTAVVPAEHESLKEALRRADEALYAAKRAGRNQAFSLPPMRAAAPRVGDAE
jgi:diguanylate cyclase (GGDEF)-like protein